MKHFTEQKTLTALKCPFSNQVNKREKIRNPRKAEEETKVQEIEKRNQSYGGNG